TAHANLANVLKDLGDADAAVAEFRQALALAPDRVDVWSNLLFTLNCVDGIPAETVFAEHRAFGERFGARVAPLPPTQRPPLAGRRLKVGYVSADYRKHAVATFFEPVLEAHDRNRIEVFCYYNQLVGDEVTQRIRASADHFVAVHGLADRDLAARIVADRVDVLV